MIKIRKGKFMGLEIAKNHVKYANKMPTRQPVGNHLNKLYDRSHCDTFKSFIKPKVDIPSDLVNNATKTFKDTFVKVTEGVPRAHAKINLKELFAQTTKVIKAIK